MATRRACWCSGIRHPHVPGFLVVRVALWIPAATITDMLKFLPGVHRQCLRHLDFLILVKLNHCGILGRSVPKFLPKARYAACGSLLIKLG
ncbi:hypothetical protein NDU88_004634 [Pleurodeles waltl]|uniref:Secreted protein n=1 Tax=Pleurodeles waltl TaxID=8319 RepID=A0AAV7W8F1_PLEWA|nr:hypothetical protein NDU88_004634 [Pleurodeles waltl]